MKMKNQILIFVLLLGGQITLGQDKKIDINSSNIKWTGKEITTKTHYGTLKFQKGNMTLKKGIVTSGEFVVDMTSLENEDLSGGSKNYLEKHLRSDDFFGVEQHPTASLVITSSEKRKGGNQTVTGNLTIKGITHPVNFDLNIKDNRATAILTFDRSKYNVKFRSSTFFDDLGDKLIYDDIELNIDLIF